MKHYLLAACTILALTGCAKRFGPLYEEAQQLYVQEKWIETIDNLNLALPFWKDADGQENKAQAYQLLGKAYHKLKKIDKASESYAKAVELSTNTYEAAYSLGLIYLTATQPEPAITAFKNALRMKKDDPWALLGLGNAYFDLGNYAEAKVVYQRVIDSAPGVREAIDFLNVINDKTKKKTVTRATKTKSSGFMRIKKR